MGNIGFKIVNSGTSVTSENIDDYIYWSKYPGLTLMSKTSNTITITNSNYLGTTAINHGYNFIPLTTAVINHTDNGNKYFVPLQNWTNTISCPKDDLDEFTEPRPAFSYNIGSTSVNIIFDVRCHSLFMGGGGPFPPNGTETFVIDLYYYMWKLGSTFST